MFEFVKNPEARRRLNLSSDRIERAYSELLNGYNLTADQILNETVRVDNYHGLVTVADISFYTICEHHFLPFYGTASVTYQPRHIVTGLGKIVRLVRDLHARKLQIQELMAKDICDDMMRILGPHFVEVKLKAKHLCVCSRGPLDDTSYTEVSYRAGVMNFEAGV